MQTGYQMIHSFIQEDHLLSRSTAAETQFKPAASFTLLFLRSVTGEFLTHADKQ